MTAKFLVALCLMWSMGGVLSKECSTYCGFGTYCDGSLCSRCPPDSFMNKEHHQDISCMKCQQLNGRLNMEVDQECSPEKDRIFKCKAGFKIRWVTPKYMECVEDNAVEESTHQVTESSTAAPSHSGDDYKARYELTLGICLPIIIVLLLVIIVGALCWIRQCRQNQTRRSRAVEGDNDRPTGNSGQPDGRMRMGDSHGPDVPLMETNGEPAGESDKKKIVNLWALKISNDIVSPNVKLFLTQLKNPANKNLRVVYRNNNPDNYPEHACQQALEAWYDANPNLDHDQCVREVLRFMDKNALIEEFDRSRLTGGSGDHRHAESPV